MAVDVQDISDEKTDLPAFAAPHRFLSAKHVCLLLDISDPTLRQICKGPESERLTVYYVGKDRRFRLHDVLWYMEKQRR